MIKEKRVVNIVFILYLIVLFFGILCKASVDETTMIDNYLGIKQFDLKGRFLLDLDPFKSYSIKGGLEAKEALYHAFLNIIAFIPIGIICGFIFKNHKFKKILLFSFLLSLTFEVTQLFVMIGGFATEDLVCNSLGGCIGYMFYLILLRTNKKQKAIITTIFIIVEVVLIIYLVTNMYKSIDIYIKILTREL